MLKNNDIREEYERNHSCLVICSAFEIISIFLIIYRGELHHNVKAIFSIGEIKVDIQGSILFVGLFLLVLIYGTKELVYKKIGKIPYLLSNKKIEDKILQVFLLLCITPMMITACVVAFEKWIL